MNGGGTTATIAGAAAECIGQPRLRLRRRAAFTLTELLVVIGIIVVLGSILLPVVLSARKNAATARIKLDLQSIAVGLEEYKKVFGDYPRQQTPNPTQGNRQLLLVKYLIGDTGDGVRMANTGDTAGQGAKKWGPFIPTEKFKIQGGMLLDSSGAEVQYYPRYNNYDKRDVAVAPAVNYDNGYLVGNVHGAGTALGPLGVPNGKAPKAMFSARDGFYADSGGPSAQAKDHLEHTLYMLGDGEDRMTGAPPANTPDNKIDPAKNESLTFSGPFMLVSAGADGTWGRVDLGGSKNYSKQSQVDDVYNFER